MAGGGGVNEESGVFFRFRLGLWRRRVDEEVGAPLRPGEQRTDHDTTVIERLEKCAKAIARKLLLREKLAGDDAWQEDIAPSLLAGSHVRQDTGEEARARRRIRSRAVNVERRPGRDLCRADGVRSWARPRRFAAPPLRCGANCATCIRFASAVAGPITVRNGERTSPSDWPFRHRGDRRSQ